jgi:hypothetical protein
MGNQKCQKDKKNDLKVRSLCVKDGKIKFLRTQNLKVDETANIKNLNTQKLILNGLDVECALRGTSGLTIGSGFDSEDGTPKKPENVSQEIFDALVEVSETQRQAFEISWRNGREKLGLPTEPGVKIFGYKTLPAGFQGCDPNAINSINSLSYDFEIINQELNLTTGLLLASVYIQLGYVDKVSGDIVISELQIGNRQFQPSIDSVGSDTEPFTTSAFGEKFNGNLQLDDKTINLALSNMPDPNNTACLQLILYIEEGLDVYIPQSLQTNNRGFNTNGATLIQASFGATVCRLDPSFTATPVSGSAPLSVKFTSNTTVGSLSLVYNWDFGDGNSSEEVSPEYTYQNPGTYNATLTLQFAEGYGCPGVTATSSPVPITVS